MGGYHGRKLPGGVPPGGGHGRGGAAALAGYEDAPPAAGAFGGGGGGGGRPAAAGRDDGAPPDLGLRRSRHRRPAMDHQTSLPPSRDSSPPLRPPLPRSDAFRRRLADLPDGAGRRRLPAPAAAALLVVPRSKGKSVDHLPGIQQFHPPVNGRPVRRGVAIVRGRHERRRRRRRRAIRGGGGGWAPRGGDVEEETRAREGGAGRSGRQGRGRCCCSLSAGFFAGGVVAGCDGGGRHRG